MVLSSKQQKWLKVFHLIFGSLWFSSIITMTAITVLANGLTDSGEFYMLNVVYHFIDFKILTPAAIGTFATGLIYSLFTNWGFFKHGWLVYKWIVTLGLILVGTFYLGPMTTEMVDISKELGLAALRNEGFLTRWQIGLGAGVINCALLFIAFIVSTLKPWKNKRK
jgi:uncharacterized membrane protein